MFWVFFKLLFHVFLYNLVFTIRLMCIEHCLLCTFLSSVKKKSTGKPLSWDLKPTTFELLEHILYHRCTNLCNFYCLKKGFHFSQEQKEIYFVVGHQFGFKSNILWLVICDYLQVKLIDLKRQINETFSQKIVQSKAMESLCSEGPVFLTSHLFI